MDAWKQAMIHRDSAGLEKYLHEGVIYSHSDGHTRQNKAEAIAAVMSGKPSIDAMEFPDPTVKVFGDTALVKGRLDITTSQDGKSSTGHVDVLHVWINGPGGWRMVARPGTKIVAPYHEEPGRPGKDAACTHAANPDPVTLFPANGAGNRVAVPGLRRIAAQFPRRGPAGSVRVGRSAQAPPRPDECACRRSARKSTRLEYRH